jgi:hypothetical protein
VLGGSTGCPRAPCETNKRTHAFFIIFLMRVPSLS